jgi:hypothetical protein
MAIKRRRKSGIRKSPIGSNIRTQEKDFGFRRIIKELKKLEEKPYVKIGYPATSSKTKDKHEEGDGFITVLDIAIIHEFGSPDPTVNLPERSFIRSSFDKNRKKYINLNKKLIEKIYVGGITVEKALDIIGETILNDIKEFLRNNEVSPKSQRAVIVQGAKTLIDTSQLMNSMTYKRVMKGRT